MGPIRIRSLLLAAAVISNCITWTASRHHYTHNVAGHPSRQRRQGAGLYQSAPYVLPGGDGSGPWGDWQEPSPCSRTCGGGVASQKRICLATGSDGRPSCTGGDTKYFSCQTQDCPDGSMDFRAEQCAKYDNQLFKGLRYSWVPYTKRLKPCQLYCKPKSELFTYRHAEKVVDGTRCSDESFNVCVDGVCQPVGCDMMLGSNARRDKCLECRGNNTNCRVYQGSIPPETELLRGYNDIVLIPAGATSISIREVANSNNYLALRSKTDDSKYYLNGEYHIDFPRSLIVAGALWHYERGQQGSAAPDKLRCQGPINEPLYLSLLLEEENVGIEYEFSLPTSVAPPPNQQYNWVHDEFTSCSATCGGGIQTRNVTCRSLEELERVDDTLCDEYLKPSPVTRTCNAVPCPAQWAEGPWGTYNKPCGEGSTKSSTVYCQKIISNGYPTVVADKECLDLWGEKPAVFQERNKDFSCPKWHTGPWNACDALCGEGNQTREVVCYEKDEKDLIKVLSDESCSEEKPSMTQPCELHPCEGVDWVTSEWTGCDSCTSKVRTRIAVCSTKNNVVSDELCSEHKKPVLEENCDMNKLPACDFQWYTSQWSKCSVVCGKGVKTRTMFCGLFDGSSVMKVEDSRCNAEENPNDTTPCETPMDKCPANWYTGPWEECPEECYQGGEKPMQYRHPVCIANNKSVFTACKGDLMPPLVRDCNLKPCNNEATEGTLEGSLTTEASEGSTEGTTSTVVAFSTKTGKTCKRRNKSKCKDTPFGCCPDNITPAGGPFQMNCTIAKTCKDTPYGCCPDGVSPATGRNHKGCPIPPCKETLFGCCTSDKKTPAKDNKQKGCPPPPPLCKSSKYGCCKDNKTKATGTNKQGCPESALGPEIEGYVMSCNASAYGCCPDGETPAHGPDDEGCCLTQPFGCCPDNYKPAEGPHREGCGCQFSHFGCCPDNVTVARGSNNEGCGCQYSQFGCCPDRHTEASGPEYEGCGCHTYQFGCCPDGSTIAKGPSLQGCHCQQSTFGCCGDGQTAATGPEKAGCDCSTSKYGCCPDGQTEAKGAKFLGCTDAPENRQAACALAVERGPCQNYTAKFYYDTEYGGCSRFMYGGCEGNGNRFDSMEECNDVCVHPAPKDSCKLPQVKGACTGNHLKWYYDPVREQCEQFVYGGCLGNDNNFASQERCQEQCEPARSEDMCRLPMEQGSCAGIFSRWGFNAESRRCEQFIWGGCEGNANRFSSEAACVNQCDAPDVLKLECLEPQEEGNCTEMVAVWSFSRVENRCVPFYYSGCGGNGNRFESEETCAEKCPSDYLPVSTRLGSSEATVAPGGELSLPCDVDGYPLPDVTWTKDGAPLASTDRITVTDSRLTIYNVEPSDSGVYGCHVRNYHSEHSSTVQVIVQGIYVPAECTDNPFFADCRLIVRTKFCRHKFYPKFCCKSCVEAGQLDPANLELDADAAGGRR